MDKKDNPKIFAISGEPVSGKGTTVKCLVKKLQEEGYCPENIHVRTTGHEFRKYFNSLVDFIQNLDDLPNLSKIGKREEIQDILKVPEYRNALKDTIVQIKNAHIDLTEFTISDANNSPQFSKIRKIVDKLIDGGIKNLGIELEDSGKKDEVWIIDSRLAFHNIPAAFSVRLTTKADIAAQRLFTDASRNKEDKYTSVQEAKEEREKRRIGERERYLKRYGVDLENPDNYDLIIDTSYSTIEDITDTILQCQKCYENGEKFGKTWASPKVLLPLQNERETYERQPFSLMDLSELAEAIKTNGYIPSEELEIVDVDGIHYIIEGHHRNFATLLAGKSLVPYKVIAKDDENIPGFHCTARSKASGLSKGILYGHEDLIETALNKNNSTDTKIKFSYNEIYPQIYETLPQQGEEGR